MIKTQPHNNIISVDLCDLLYVIKIGFQYKEHNIEYVEKQVKVLLGQYIQLKIEKKLDMQLKQQNKKNQIDL